MDLGRDILGECGVWWPERCTLFWIDIRNEVIHGVDTSTSERFEWKMPALVGGICLTDADRLLVALESHLYLLDVDTAQMERLSSPRQWRPDLRFNELRADPSGRAWVGCMNDRTRDPEGWLFRLDGETFDIALEGVAVPNSLAWSPDGSSMYFSDGVSSTIWEFDFDVNSGRQSNRREFSTLPDHRGIPDGAAVDIEGCLWSANYGGSAITKFAADGSVDRVIEMPVSQPTACVFGGDDLDILFVTTASQRLSQDQLAKQPLAGEIFAMRTETPGLPIPRLQERLLVGGAQSQTGKDQGHAH